jgi:hypothetical protein
MLRLQEAIIPRLGGQYFRNAFAAWLLFPRMI